ncbi:MAG: flagellar basal body-associated FliL family protein [Alphaproteobacteria bacterium]|uniref:flagellar basal body-associated FliL family protein n=1 Tax=Brevundimonas sp. TaxID=1871086 RepID=UPI0017AC3A9F|nr:flagellar basal body-associated FliL family protein [Brevundimonas sp.]MBA3050129.1 flagellar basal body protein FliL [Brevundimonas sp.]MBU3971993.1 flagellar basal body-associated FliL family protein [Alphaproteobacteria bacterium]MBU3974153.1 flagellar basal body-associated FliL family protein [Alphaproteobacteria bacterium]MBU4039855.1 flagellar basal body-associated FliL family protein [Alphaproteobacteria bacterium]
MFKFGKKKGAKEGGDDAANLPAVSDAPGAEGEDGAPPKKKLPLLFIVIPAALVVLGGGGAAAFFMMQPKPAAAEDGGHGAEKKGGHDKKAEKKGGGHGAPADGPADASLGVIAEGPDGVTFFTLPDMVVNIQSPDGRPTFLKLKLTLETHDAAVAEQLQGEMPRMQDMFQGFLRELRPEDLAGSSGSFQLRAEILRRVNLIAAPGKVDAVLIEEMLVQ